MGAVAEGDVLALEADEFGDAQAGLDGDEEERAVASAEPGGWVGAGEQGFGFVLGEVLDVVVVVAFAGDREDALAVEEVPGVAEGDVAVEGVDRCQAGVAAAGAVAALVFEVVEEVAEEGGASRSAMVSCEGARWRRSLA